MNCINRCNCCDNFIKSTSIELGASGEIVVTIPNMAIVNGQQLCILLAQNFPEITTTAIVPRIVIGVNGGTYGVTQENACGSQGAVNYLYATQLKQKNGCPCSRQILKLKYGSDTQLFNYVGGCLLKTSPVTAILPVPTA